MGIYEWPRKYPQTTKTYSLKKNGNVKLSAHFNLKEFQSKDGDNTIVICPYLIEGLEKLFTQMKAYSINIVSGYRSISHSKAVGGAGASDNHHMGQAADIRVKKNASTYYTAKEVACALQQMGWKHGIGLMSTSVHMDAGSQYWFDETKKSGGKYVIVADWYTYTGIKAPTSSSLPAPVTVQPKPGVKPTPTYKGKAYVLTCKTLNVRASAKLGAKKVGTLKFGQTFHVDKWDGHWGHIEEFNGWASVKTHCKVKK